MVTLEDSVFRIFEVRILKVKTWELLKTVKKQESNKPACEAHRDLYLDSMDMVETNEKTVIST